jgi:hypothetical protein
MRFVLSLILSAGVVAAIGCGDGEKSPIKEATAEDIRQQKEAENRVNAEESARQKMQPKENTNTHQQSVDEQERARRR